MEEKELSKVANDEAAERTAQEKKSRILNATLIGFMAGIIIFSVANNSIGLLSNEQIISGAFWQGKF